MPATPGPGVWVNVSIPGAGSGVAGPFTGQGVFQLASAGIHLYQSQADAQAASPQVLNAAQAQAFAAAQMAGPGIGQGFFGLGQEVAAAPGNVAGAVSSALNPFGFLGQTAFWLRVGEVVAGIVLLAIGVNTLMKGRPLAVVTTAAGGVGKVVP